MKKLLITIALLAGALGAQGQFVVSLHLNGSIPNSTVTNTISKITSDYHYTPDYSVTPPSYTLDSVTRHSVPVDQMELKSDPYLMLGGGLKVGYQIQRLQFGVWGSFNWVYTHNDQDAKRYLTNNPHINIHSLTRQANNLDTAIVDGYQGWFKEHYTYFTVAPYMRVELIQAGDVALFIEANGFYTKVNKPEHHDYLDWTYKEMHWTIDTSFTIDNTVMSYGLMLTPGLSWQLSPHCLLDLYFDFLALSYRYTKQEIITVKDEYNRDKEPWVLDKRTTITDIVEETDLGFDLDGAPTMHSRIGNTWVHVGLAFTF